MGFGSNQLRDKALLALEETVQECRYREPRRTLALRFALAYLWALKPTDRGVYDEFWHALAKCGMWRFSHADSALGGIYRHLEIERDERVSWDLWKRAQEEFAPRDANGVVRPLTARSQRDAEMVEKP